jgi:hypothetical protein
MRCIRNRSGVVAAIVLTWHVVAMAAVSTVLCEDQGPGMTMDHAAMTGHEGMVDCPLQRNTTPVCPKHSGEHGAHECDCPTLGCSQTDTGFMALFGAIGILVSAPDVAAPLNSGDASPILTLSAIRLAPHPPSPPPRT